MADHFPLRLEQPTSLTASAEQLTTGRSSPLAAEQTITIFKQLASAEPPTSNTSNQFTAKRIPCIPGHSVPVSVEPPTVDTSGQLLTEQVPTVSEKPAVIPARPPKSHTFTQSTADQISTLSEQLALAEPPTSDTSSQATTEPYLFSDTGSRTSQAGSVNTTDNFSDEGYSASNTTSYLSSVASNIRRGVTEDGRVHPNYGKNMYDMPIDEQELDRERLSTPQRILDLGTGTVIWAISMADRYPSAQVTGVDIAPIQPSWTPPNCIFELDDVEEDWSFKKESFDFIYAREFLTAIRDWDRLVKQSFEHLKHVGWLELSATVPHIRSDDDSIPKDSAYVEAGKIFFEMATKMGCPLEAPRSWKERVESNGFVDVTEVIYKLPTGPWVRDERLKEIGAVERMMLLEGFEAYLLRRYTQILGGNLKTLQVILAQARQEISDPKIHTYVFYHIVYGRKPGQCQP